MIEVQLLKKCIKGRRRAQNQLYKELYSPLMSVCFRYRKNEDDAAILLNESYLKILTNLKSFIANNEPAKFIYWAKRITINTAIDHIRKDDRYQKHFKNQDWNTVPDFAIAVDQNRADQELEAEDLYKMLDVLSESKKLVFNLFAIEGYSHKEIAEKLEIKEPHSRWLLSSARKELGSAIEEHFGILKSKLVK